MRGIARYTLLLFCAAVAWASSAAVASGASTIGAGYSAPALRDGANAGYSCRGWSGGSDAQANTYLPCGSFIYRLSATAQLTHMIALPEGMPSFRDVAASADGELIYYVAGHADIDVPNRATHPHLGKLLRLRQQPDGSYTSDHSFAVGPIPYAGKEWSIRNVDIDQNGRIYVTVNAFVRVYSPEGALLFEFGGDDRWNGLTYQGGLEVGQGLAVTPDGLHVYVTEQRHNHIQRWDYSPTGNSWIRAPWQIGHLTQVSDCVDNNTFASPYDVGLDGAGSLYVLDTSCRRIQRYDATSGAHTGTVWRDYPPVGNGGLYHGFAADYRGNLVVAEQGTRYAAPAVLACGPDSDAPTFTQVVVPAVSYTATVAVQLQATDRCSKVVSMRVTGDVQPIDWSAYRSAFSITLSAGDGAKRVDVSVRDSYGRITTHTLTVTLDTSQPPLRARARTDLRGATRLCRPDPLRTIQNRKAYRLLDACATYAGRIKTVRRSGKTVSLELELSLAVSQRLYTNARRPATVWIVGAAQTPRRGRYRVGGSATVTSALIVNRAAQLVAGAPVYHWRFG